MAAIDDVTELQDAIQNYMWTQSNDFKTACIGGLHYEQFPDNKDEVHPYCFYEFVSVIDDIDSCSNNFEATIRFWFKDKIENNNQNISHKVLSAVMAEFDKRFDDCENSLNLIMTNIEAISVDKIGKQRKPPTRTVANRWEGYRDYKISIDRK